MLPVEILTERVRVCSLFLLNNPTPFCLDIMFVSYLLLADDHRRHQYDYIKHKQTEENNVFIALLLLMPTLFCISKHLYSYIWDAAPVPTLTIYFAGLRKLFGVRSVDKVAMACGCLVTLPLKNGATAGHKQSEHRN